MALPGATPSPEPRLSSAPHAGSRWLDDTRTSYDTGTSYDTVAVGYADLLRVVLGGEPFQRGILALFAELVCAQGTGRSSTSAAVRAGSPPTCTAWAWTRSASTCHPR
jgi:hypothetical protein